MPEWKQEERKKKAQEKSRLRMARFRDRQKSTPEGLEKMRLSWREQKQEDRRKITEEQKAKDREQV